MSETHACGEEEARKDSYCTLRCSSADVHDLTLTQHPQHNTYLTQLRPYDRRRLFWTMQGELAVQPSRWILQRKVLMQPPRRATLSRLTWFHSPGSLTQPAHVRLALFKQPHARFSSLTLGHTHIKQPQTASCFLDHYGQPSEYNKIIPGLMTSSSSSSLSCSCSCSSFSFSSFSTTTTTASAAVSAASASASASSSSSLRPQSSIPLPLLSNAASFFQMLREGGIFPLSIFDRECLPRDRERGIREPFCVCVRREREREK